jgi:hypothetical protein
MVKDYSREQFLELVRAGLFLGNEARIMAHGTPVDWGAVYRLAEEQSVLGLVAAGIETSPPSERPPQEVILQFVGQTLQQEQRNKAMNAFVADLIETLRENDIYTLLVKGQGIARCYERSLWRACGDVDLLLSEDNYREAKAVLGKMAGHAERETVKNAKRMHQEYQIGGWTVELHGTMHSDLSRKIDREINRVQGECIYGGSVRSEEFKSSKGARVQVFLPGANEDVIFVFTHILQHLFLEGIGLRQICDWCRLLYTYRGTLDYGLLESRIMRMGLMTEWKTFYNLASRYLGMPDELQVSRSMFQVDSRFDKKADRMMSFIFDVGNFGHNREVEWSHASRRRMALIRHKITDTIRLSRIFPVDAPTFLLNYAWDGVKGLMK